VVNSRGIGVAFARLSGFSILLLVLLALGCGVPSVVSPGSPSETAPGEVKFEMAGPNKAAMIVRVKIKWTGALRLRARYGRDLTCVDQQLAEELKLPNWSGPLGSIVMSGGE
jgi:hypothetical protein